MVRPLDFHGKKFGRLTVLRRVESTQEGKACWLCRCDCGAERSFLGANLKRGFSRSCGCLRTEEIIARSTKHGHAKRKAKDPTYTTWCSMINRCTNPNSKNYKRYGGLGVAVSKRWLVYTNFLADMGARPKGKTLDRKNPFGGYNKRNCRWASPMVQAWNMRKHYLKR